MLELRDVRVRVPGREILKGVSAIFSSHGLFFILGPNGSGKSTLLQAIAALIDFEGDVLLNGKSVKEMSRKEIASKIGYVWQNPFYGFFERTVRREIAFILKNLGIWNDAKVETIARYFGIENLLERSPFTLSGGEAKRVSISSVIIGEQLVWLLDEPEAEMDLSGLNKLIELLGREKDRRLIIVATHSTHFAYKLRRKVDGIILLRNGEASEILSPSVLEDSDLLESYGLVSKRWWDELA